MLTVRRDVIEETAIAGLKEQLMQPDAHKAFVAKFHREMNRLAATEDQERDRLTRDLFKVEREIGQLVEAIKSGVPGESVREELGSLEEKRKQFIAKQRRRSVVSSKPSASSRRTVS